MPERKPNVLLVVVDALRYDYLRGEKSETPSSETLDDETPGSETPRCDAFAEEATEFRRAVSPAPWTLPSVTSMLTGKYPHEHGADSRQFQMQSGRTVTEDLREAGYRCLHLSPKTWIGDWLPQGQGFHRVEEFTGPDHRHFDLGADVRRLSEGVARGPEWYATVLRRALRSENPLFSLANVATYKYREATEDAWLDDVRASERAAKLADRHFAQFADSETRSVSTASSAERSSADSRAADPRDDGETASDDNEPFFAYAHLMDPHLPFYVPEEFRTGIRPPGRATYEAELDYFEDLMDDLWEIRLGERHLSDPELRFLRRRYADEVEYVDWVIGRILDSLADHGLADDTLVVLTADHGEHLGEGDGHLAAGDGHPGEADGDLDRGERRTLLDHQTSVGLPLVRVPLLVRLPDRFDATLTESAAETAASDERDDLVQTNYVAETIRALAGLEYDSSRSLLADDKEAARNTAIAEYAGVVRSHPPEEVADERLFRTRRTAIAGEWKLDRIGDQLRARRIDWAANETTAVSLDAVPERVRANLQEAISSAEEGGGPASGGGDRGEGDGDRSVPEDVESNLRELGYL